jgi:hypothetical protein
MPSDSYLLELKQMFLTRAILADLINPKSKAMKSGFMQDKDLKDSHVESIKEFLDKTWQFDTFPNFQRLLHNACDLSFLWLREYHLGLSNSVEVKQEHDAQFFEVS